MNLCKFVPSLYTLPHTQPGPGSTAWYPWQPQRNVFKVVMSMLSLTDRQAGSWQRARTTKPLTTRLCECRCVCLCMHSFNILPCRRSHHCLVCLMSGKDGQRPDREAAVPSFQQTFHPVAPRQIKVSRRHKNLILLT